jgi:hypothetical protein
MHPFLKMAIAASVAAMAQQHAAQQFAEKHMISGHGRRTRSRIPGPARPAGSKLARLAAEGRCAL